jgi:hypothetical protein
MKSTRTGWFAAATALLVATPFAAGAQSQPQGAPPSGGAPHGPPPEAIAACTGKAVGVVASFTDRRGRTVSGPCTQMGDVVAVPRPARPQGDKDGPPPSR